ncbi:MAG: aspartate kinase, partial [Thermoanaerobaculia bacterium]
MSIVVQKYGGTSVGSVERIRQVADQVVSTHRDGRSVVVVVSAMGGTTDSLLDRARELSSDPNRRELDMLLSSGERVSIALLSMAIQENGVDAISLTGPQSGIRTDGRHFAAQIRDVRPERVLEELASDRVVVVAGYQGESSGGEITTLGRGGSDTTAVALAAALRADRCEIRTDVDGVYSADPRVVEEAAPLAEISYDEMLELARQGASVLEPRCVRHARDHGVELRVCSAVGEGAGTRVVPRTAADAATRIAGVASHSDLVRLRLGEGAFESSLHHEVIDAIAETEVLLDRREADRTRRDVVVSALNLPSTDRFVADVRNEFGRWVDLSTDEGSVSAIGHGAGEEDLLRRAVALHEDEEIA